MANRILLNITRPRYRACANDWLTGRSPAGYRRGDSIHRNNIRARNWFRDSSSLSHDRHRGVWQYFDDLRRSICLCWRNQAGFWRGRNHRTLWRQGTRLLSDGLGRRLCRCRLRRRGRRCWRCWRCWSRTRCAGSCSDCDNLFALDAANLLPGQFILHSKRSRTGWTTDLNWHDANSAARSLASEMLCEYQHVISLNHEEGKATIPMGQANCDESTIAKRSFE